MNLQHEAERVARDILRCAGPEADSPAAVAYAARCVIAFAERASREERQQGALGGLMG